jgi:hypothetical protein
MPNNFTRISFDLVGTDAKNMEILINKVTPLFNNKKHTALRTILTLIMADVPKSDKWGYRDKLRHVAKNKKSALRRFAPYGKRSNKRIQGKPDSPN